MQKTKPELKIDWATHEAAKYACENWHYSKCMPAGKTVKIGVWEFNKFIGVVIYSYGANNNAAKSFGVSQYECCELTRVALTNHYTPVSRVLSISIKMLKKVCPKLKVLFSYSDLSDQGHHGGIYQANGWTYLGERKTSNKGAYYLINGKQMHGRSARAKYGNEKNFPKGWSHVASKTKHLYVKILDNDYTLKFKQYCYPKRASSVESGTSEFHSEGGGESPTDALQFDDFKTNKKMNGI
jgi:hypothetical protein